MVKKLTIFTALGPFLVKPREKLHLARISREINEPHPTVRQWLNMLEHKGVLKKEYQGRLTLYSLNLQNPNIITYLVLSEKFKLLKKCEKWPVFWEIVSNINLKFNENVKVLIFGSAAESFSNANDIDMLIVGKQDLKEIKKLAKRLNKGLHIIQVKSLNKISQSLKNEILKKHLLVKGSEDLVRWMLWQQ
ncbi:hypothetical protein KY347_01755 [Candidatus Woesearchaeota archaeon]|nr:hypothetical protein [Candidatus Woesearchaeota archaeon]